MTNRSYFNCPLRSDALCAMAKRFDPTSRVEASGSISIESTARVPDLDETSIGYFDGLAWARTGRRIGVLITTPESAPAVDAMVKIVTAHPRRLFIQMINAILDENTLDYARTVDDIGVSVSHGESRIDPRAVVMPGTRIGAGCVVEAASIVFPGTVLEDGVHIKSASLIATSGAAIDIDDTTTASQPHLGTVVIGRNTEIGSQTNIVRGIFGATRIGQRCVIGNQVNIGHNVVVGHGVWVGAGAILAGHGTVGNFTNIGMGAMCKNGITIGDKCNIGMASCVTRSLPDGSSCFGNPAKVLRHTISAGPARAFPLTDT